VVVAADRSGNLSYTALYTCSVPLTLVRLVGEQCVRKWTDNYVTYSGGRSGTISSELEHGSEPPTGQSCYRTAHCMTLCVIDFGRPTFSTQNKYFYVRTRV
jgi:hypothetical protein